ncbi:MAG: hypothetical protein KC418_13675 [Anaerolineales bacterium]|nr:hypothetical protein [Anaerolineales bacterium]MCB8952871.1 hypothetical protein [Ardenticatenales bacterium]
MNKSPLVRLSWAVFFLAIALFADAYAAPPTPFPPFVLPAQGCPMAHCDAQMTDWENALPPGPEARIIWRDAREGPPGEPLGSSRGLGCAGNGEIVACTFGLPLEDDADISCDPQIQDTLVVYAYTNAQKTPDILWTSGDLLNCTANTSAPLVGVSGGVIAADDTRIIRFAPNGIPLWQTATPGGKPISPVLLDSGLILLATVGGPVSVYNSETGEMGAQLSLGEGASFYETINTPAVNGNRVYISTQLNEDPTYGRLYALDVTPGPPANIQVAWHFNFGGPSGASPLLIGDTLYFDGNRSEPGGAFAPQIYAVQDTGSIGQLLWVKPMPGEIQASFARDPRGGFWAFSVGTPLKDNRWLTRMRFTDLDGDGVGDVWERIDLDALVNLPGVHVPSSAMSIAGTADTPIMIVSATAFAEDGSIDSTYVVAVDLAARARFWRVWLPSDLTAGQFAVTLGALGPRVFFTNKTEGAWVIGRPLTYTELLPAVFAP